MGLKMTVAVELVVVMTMAMQVKMAAVVKASVAMAAGWQRLSWWRWWASRTKVGAIASPRVPTPLKGVRRARGGGGPIQG